MASWMKLREWSNQTGLTVPDTVGGEVQIDRAETLTKLRQELEVNAGVVLTAPSGFGKSVVIRQFVEQLHPDREALWLEASSPYLAPTEIRNHLNLTYTLDELLEGATSHFGYLIVDAVEQLVAPQDFRRLAQLAHAASAQGSDSPWRVLLVCQSEGWERVRRELSKANSPVNEWKMVTLDLPSSDQLAAVWKSFPALRPLSLRRELRQVVWRPKLLDMAARALQAGHEPDVKNWVGESSVIQWFWATEVQGGPDPLGRARALRRVAEVQADEMLPRVPSDRIAEVLTTVEQLVEARLLERQGERVRFSHDLYGDWSRQRVLLEKEEGLAEYLETRISSPLWHRAVRLYGVHLLEQEGPDTWKAAFEGFTDLGETGATIQDLLLESLVFAADPFARLQALLVHFTADGGLLLRRFLARFLAVATLSNPVSLAMARETNPASWVAAAMEDRLPEWPLWFPVLRFLKAHREECIRLAPRELAALCECWLRKGGKGWLFRDLTTRIALDLSSAALNNQAKYGKNGKQLARMAFLAALAGYDDLPEEVLAFALRASGRIGEPEYTPDFERDGRKWIRIPSIIHSETVPLPEPWPDGPIARRNDSFAEICLKEGGLVPVMASAPELAKEVLLALLIELPRPRSSSDHVILREAKFGLHYSPEWYPPFWSHLPLMCFFLLHPEHATDFVLRLVHFATDRWADLYRKRGRTVPCRTVIIDGEARELAGDVNVYYWFRDGGAPAAVVSALMAIEKHLYHGIDQNQDISPILDAIVGSMQSVAFAGMLSAVAAKCPNLYAGRLSFLLFEPLFFEWEGSGAVRIEGAQMIAWSGASPDSARRAREWHEMPHRRTGIPTYGPRVFLSAPALEEQFEEARARWRKERDEALISGAQEFVDVLDQMLARYDRANYEELNLEDGRRVLRYRLPKVLEARFAPAAAEAQDRLETTIFPFQCSQILQNEVELTEDQCEAFWLSIRNLKPLPEEHSVDLRDGLCAGAAVLLLRKRGWLDQYPDRREWCVETLLQTVENPPAPGRYDTDISVTNTDWVHFCAQAIPVLWAEEPGSKRLRRAVSALCSDFRYATVRFLTTGVFAVRCELGDDHHRFWHLLRAWAVERWREKDASHQHAYISEAGTAAEATDCNTGFNTVLNAFIDGSLSTELPPLPDPVPQEAPVKPNGFSGGGVAAGIPHRR